MSVRRWRDANAAPHIRTFQLGLVGQQLLQSRINLRVTLREPVTQFIRDALDLEIAACPIPDAIPEATQLAEL